MDVNTKETNLQAFVRALYRACDASKRVDNLDLRSDDPGSVQQWNCLLDEQRAGFRELHEVCRRVPVEDLVDDAL